jgi:hypothetical protein
VEKDAACVLDGTRARSFRRSAVPVGCSTLVPLSRLYGDGVKRDELKHFQQEER